MLARIGYITFLFFGAMNAVSAPIIYFLFPEVANKSLEEVNLLFTSDNVLVRKNMAAYHQRLDAANGNVALAARRLFDEVDLLELRKHGQVEDGITDHQVYDKDYSKVMS